MLPADVAPGSGLRKGWVPRHCPPLGAAATALPLALRLGPNDSGLASPASLASLASLDRLSRLGSLGSSRGSLGSLLSVPVWLNVSAMFTNAGLALPSKT